MHRIRMLGASVAIIGFLGLLLTSGSAMARPSFSAITAPLTSTSFAGWVFGDTGTVTTLITYKEPTLKCTSATQGVSAYASVFTGTSTAAEETAAGTLIVCSGGTAAYIPFLVINNTETNLSNPVAAGDTIKVMTSGSPTKVTATFMDLTTARKFAKTLTGTSTTSVLGEQLGDGLVDSSGTAVPVVNFGSIAFRGGKINNTLLGAVSSKAGPYDMETSTKVLQIATTALVGKPTASGFNTTWKHS